jgi:hypothetical protein
MKYLLLSVTFAFYFFGFSYNDETPVANQAKVQKAGCAPSNSRLQFNYNDVAALMEPGGLMFLDRANGKGFYEVPAGSGSSAIYAASLWMGGVDVNNQLKIAAQKFRSGGNDFWTGPLSTKDGVAGDYDPSKPVGDGAVHSYGDGNISAETCKSFDRFFTIRKSEVIQFITWFECKAKNEANCVSPSNEVLNRIYAWPAHGDVSLSQDYYLAPFKDVDNDGSYDPLKGDYPWYDDILGRDDIKCGSDRRISLFGDETHWWVFNDKGNIHTETNGEPIGMEIRAQAFAFATSDEVNKMTFYNYEMINRGTQTLYNTYFAQYVDSDLGGAPDDFVGCDVTRGLGYCYNGDSYDDDYRNQKGYGANPPAIGVDFFEGPYQDADGKDNPGPQLINSKWTIPSVTQALEEKGIVYNGLGIGYGDGIIDNERYGMKRFTYYTGGAANNQSDPTFAPQYYNYMSGKWRYGDDMVYGGTGFPNSKGATKIHSDYMFPSDSDTLNWATAGVDPGSKIWDEKSTGNTPGDRRFVQSAGPFTLRPGAVNNITVGIVWARSSEGDGSISALKRADTKAQNLFDNCFKILEPPSAPKLDIQELDKSLVLTLSNPKTSNNYGEKYEEEDVNIDLSYADRKYHFEGYLIYQLKSKDVKVDELENSDKAALVARCDIKNGINRIVNFEFDEELGFATPVEKVDRSGDQGLKHSFIIKEDKFSKAGTLVNNKTYYYVAVAYAYNNFKMYVPDEQTSLDGQKTPFIRSRNSYDGSTIKASSAVPHPTITEDKILKTSYGSTPKIKRIDGRGNGNRWLELTDESKSEIVSNGFAKEVEYKQGKGPLNVKVIDPLMVTGGYYTCKFNGYVSDTNKNFSNFDGSNVDKASWVIYKYDKEGGSLKDSVTSELTIAYDNEQIIPKWGISVNIYQNPYYFATDTFLQEYLRYTDPISPTVSDVSISYKDSTKKWLSFISDVDTYEPDNWIRSGDYEPQASEDNKSLGWNNPFLYPDEKGVDPDKKYAKLLNGGIAPHCLVGYQGDYMPLAYPSFFNKSQYSEARQYSSISRLTSIDIVFTSDTSLWTKCPVIELGRNKQLNEGGAEAGTLRKGVSVDKNGNKIAGSTGMGWFPGYAIDLESGMRLHMAFGENSSLVIDNGRDMIWNPSSTIYDNSGQPHMGGQHPIYIFGYNVHGYRSDLTKNCPYYDGKNNWVYDRLALSSSPTNYDFYKDVYHSLQWVLNPVLAYEQTLLSTDITLKVRVNKEFNDFKATNLNSGKPMYAWSMDDIAAEVASTDVKKDALSLINVVPNPYYAYSAYEATSNIERSQFDTRVKITNLPRKCNIKIYNLSGKLIKNFKIDLSSGYEENSRQVTSIDWDLKNNKGIPVAGGVYLIHVEVPGVGETIIKFFGGMRQPDLENI